MYDADAPPTPLRGWICGGEGHEVSVRIGGLLARMADESIASLSVSPRFSLGGVPLHEATLTRPFTCVGLAPANDDRAVPFALRARRRERSPVIRALVVGRSAGATSLGQPYDASPLLLLVGIREGGRWADKFLVASVGEFPDGLGPPGELFELPARAFPLSCFGIFDGDDSPSGISEVQVPFPIRVRPHRPTFSTERLDAAEKRYWQRRHSAE